MQLWGLGKSKICGQARHPGKSCTSDSKPVSWQSPFLLGEISLCFIQAFD